MQTEVECPNCRSLNSNASVNCRLCGAALTAAGVPIPPQTNQFSPQYTQPPTAPHPTQPPPQGSQYAAPQQPQQYPYTQPYPTQPQQQYPNQPYGYGAQQQQYPQQQPYYQSQPHYTQPQQGPYSQFPPYGHGYTQPYPQQQYGNPLNPARVRSKALLWLLFLAATALAWAVAAPLGNALVDASLRAIAENSTSEVNLWVLLGAQGLIFGLVIGLISGLFQWGAMRAAGFRVGSTWPVTSTIGWGLGLAIAFPVATYLLQRLAEGGSPGLLQTALLVSGITGLIGGLFAGVFGLPSLSDRAARPGLWTFGSMLAWGICFSVVAVFLVMGNVAFPSTLAWATSGEIGNQILQSLAVGAAGGALSGAALAGVV
jgi:hypothetical protein